MDTNKQAKRRKQVIKDVSYVYEDYPYWDKSTKQNCHKRVYIGKIGEDGAFIPNKTYQTRQYKTEEKGASDTPVTPAFRYYYGATHLLDEISKVTGIWDDLRSCFPDQYRELLSLAYYLVLESDSPMYRFSRWAHDHKHPCGEDLSSQRISELMRDISEHGRLEFFKRQSRRRQETEYLAYDTTSVSSWSECINGVRYGKNKDNDGLPQVNMALVFGGESSMPVYYRVLPGNITDVMTIRKLLKDIGFLEINKLKLVMDRGFYSEKNINELYKGHYKFLIATKANNAFVSRLIDKAKVSIHHYSHYDEDHDVYCTTSTENWLYIQKDRIGNISREENRRMYVHIYYNGMRAEEEKARFAKALAMVGIAVKSKTEMTDAQRSLREKYFILKETPKRGMRIRYNDEAIQKHMEQFGYFALLSNDIKDPVTAIDVYRKKDVVEKAFNNLKERLDMRRTTVHSDETLAGKFFLQFLALMFVSFIHKHMRDNNLYRNFTMQSLLDDLDIIERFEYRGQRVHCGEITKKQRDLFACFGVCVPNTV